MSSSHRPITVFSTSHNLSLISTTTIQGKYCLHFTMKINTYLLTYSRSQSNRITAKKNSNSDSQTIQRFSNLILDQNSYVGLLRPKSLGLYSFWSVDLGWGLMMCISFKFKGNDVAGSRSHLENYCPTSCFWWECQVQVVRSIKYWCYSRSFVYT